MLVWTCRRGVGRAVPPGVVRHRTSLKNRVHATLKTHGLRVEASDIFGVNGCRRLAELQIPELWASAIQAAELKRLGADHRYVSLLETIPGVGWTLGYTIAAELGDIHRFASPAPPS